MATKKKKLSAKDKAQARRRREGREVKPAARFSSYRPDRSRMLYLYDETPSGYADTLACFSMLHALRRI